MIPWIIFGVVAIAVLALGVGLVRSRKAIEHPADETDADRAELEREFAAAEAYTDKWREEHHKELEDERIP